MKTFRVILFAFALAIFSAGGVARAEESPPAGSPVVAQAQAPAQAPARSGDDDRQATLGDLRESEARINARIDGLESRMNGRMIRMEARLDGQERELRELREDLRQIRDMMQTHFQWLMAAIIAVLGLPQFFGWMTRMRASGKSAAAAALFLIVLAGGTAMAVSSCEAAAGNSESVQIFRKQLQHPVLDEHFISVAPWKKLGDFLGDLWGDHKVKRRGRETVEETEDAIDCEDPAPRPDQRSGKSANNSVSANGNLEEFEKELLQLKELERGDSVGGSQRPERNAEIPTGTGAARSAEKDPLSIGDPAWHRQFSKRDQASEEKKGCEVTSSRNVVVLVIAFILFILAVIVFFQKRRRNIAD